MTEQLRSSSSVGYSTKMETDLSPRKTMLVLVIVVGCFAVLWPKVFYPMLVGSANQHIKPSAIDKTTGCCDVISEIDVNTIKIIAELCGTIIKQNEDETLSDKEIFTRCRSQILETCGIDISVILQEQVRLGQNVKQILDEIRSLNGSLCLKYNFGVAPWRLGVPHRVTVNLAPTPNIRQERPLHLRSELIHPAFRERGRAIPQPQPVLPTRPPPRVVEGRPGPVPGMRPTIGGAGHVVPPSKQGTNSMSVIMPIYTIGIVIFFTYTLMKILFKKQPEGPGGSLYPPIEPDPHFQKEVFESEKIRLAPKLSRDVSSKLVVNAMSALLDEVDQEIEARRKANEVSTQDLVNGLSNGSAVKSQEPEEQPTVHVLGMEMTASCEGGKKWSRSNSPILQPTPIPPITEPVSPPQEIYLEGALPAQSHLLVADSATEAQPNIGEDPAVVLAGKMTLSVISLDSSENGASDAENGTTATVEQQPIHQSITKTEDVVKTEQQQLQLEEEINEAIQEIETEDIKNVIDNLIQEAEIVANVEEHEIPIINDDENTLDSVEEIINYNDELDTTIENLNNLSELEKQIEIVENLNQIEENNLKTEISPEFVENANAEIVEEKIIPTANENRREEEVEIISAKNEGNLDNLLDFVSEANNGDHQKIDDVPISIEKSSDVIKDNMGIISKEEIVDNHEHINEPIIVPTIEAIPQKTDAATNVENVEINNELIDNLQETENDNNSEPIIEQIVQGTQQMEDVNQEKSLEPTLEQAKPGESSKVIEEISKDQKLSEDENIIVDVYEQIVKSNKPIVVEQTEQEESREQKIEDVSQEKKMGTEKLNDIIKHEQAIDNNEQIEQTLDNNAQKTEDQTNKHEDIVTDNKQIEIDNEPTVDQTIQNDDNDQEIIIIEEIEVETDDEDGIEEEIEEIVYGDSDDEEEIVSEEENEVNTNRRGPNRDHVLEESVYTTVSNTTAPENDIAEEEVTDDEEIEEEELEEEEVEEDDEEEVGNGVNNMNHISGGLGPEH